MEWLLTALQSLVSLMGFVLAVFAALQFNEWEKRYYARRVAEANQSRCQICGEVAIGKRVSVDDVDMREIDLCREHFIEAVQMESYGQDHGDSFDAGVC